MVVVSQELQSEAESLEKFKDEVLELSENVLLFLKECSNTSATALSEKLKQLQQSYQRWGISFKFRTHSSPMSHNWVCINLYETSVKRVLTLY